MEMNYTEAKKNAQEFAERWLGRGDEKQDTAHFWIDLLQSVYGVQDVVSVLEFEKRVKLSHTSFIDGYIPSTKVLIEQKGANIDLFKSYKQSDHSSCTPYEQAKRYANELPLSEKPRFIVVCNFKEFLIYDEERPHSDPYQIKLEDLPDEFPRLSFLVNLNQTHLNHQLSVSFKAGELVGKIYDAILKEYRDPKNPHSLQSLNILCVRLVFCLYAEDAGLFMPNQFCDFLQSKDPEHLRRALIDLFAVLNTKEEDRDPYLEAELKAFPYVNGGLFEHLDIEIPCFTADIQELLSKDASEQFNWSQISPTIFGAIFESTLNPETRREGGMHYTSVENIHKVIDPLFLTELEQEYAALENEILSKYQKRDAMGSNRLKKGLLEEDRRTLSAFQDKLASLRFLDPACGSGNFLTETFLSLRRLENKVLLLLNATHGLFVESTVKVSISQFYGIEINDFAVSVAKTAMWIAEAQMLEESNAILTKKLDFLPLKSYVNIVEGNALRLDWNTVVKAQDLNYIIGNPPFAGFTYQTEAQKADLKQFPAAAKSIDYVTGWYFKAADYMQDTEIEAAFVSTNSICQGEQTALVWKPLMEAKGVVINFAWRTFTWDTESADKAHVHCVIIGFSCADINKDKFIFDEEKIIKARHINAYLIDADDIFIATRNIQISDLPKMHMGSKPTDAGNLIMTLEEKAGYLKKEPQGEAFIRPFMMGKDFIERRPRWCFWLKGADPALINKCPLLQDRLQKVKEYRLQSSKKATQQKAATPYLFDECHESATSYIAFPKVTSESRKYVPLDFLPSDIIAGDNVYMMEQADLCAFGVLNSSVFMSWLRAVCGRLKSDYRFSNTVVYNNFVFPKLTDQTKAKITNCAQNILDARKLYPDSSFADLYNPLTMPPELLRAHQANDKAVMSAYGFKTDLSEGEIVAELFRLYQSAAADQGKRS